METASPGDQSIVNVKDIFCSMTFPKRVIFAHNHKKYPTTVSAFGPSRSGFMIYILVFYMVENLDKIWPMKYHLSCKCKKTTNVWWNGKRPILTKISPLASRFVMRAPHRTQLWCKWTSQLINWPVRKVSYGLKESYLAGWSFQQEQPIWKCTEVYFTRSYQWRINIVSGNGSVGNVGIGSIT